MLLKNKRIFLVEDDLANRAIIQLLLENQGAQTAIDRWGQETCQRLHNFMPVDLILLDLMFPGEVTGFDIFEQIRNISEFDLIPIVALTAADITTALPKAQRLGFAGFIQKPVNYELFAKQIATILDGEEIWQKL